METQLKHRYIRGRFLRFNTEKMIHLGRLMEIAAEDVAPFPAPFHDAFQPFFSSVAHLLRVASLKSEPVPKGPAVGPALDAMKDAIRTLGRVIIAYTTSTIPSIKAAALRLKQRILPKGLAPTTEGQDDLGGWTAVTLHQLQGVYRPLVAELHAMPVVEALETAYQEYRKRAAKAQTRASKVPPEHNLRNLLNVCRQHLEDALIDMNSMLRRHPDLLFAVQTIVRPLDRMTARELARKAEMKRKAVGEAEALLEAPGGNAEDEAVVNEHLADLKAVRTTGLLTVSWDPGFESQASIPFLDSMARCREAGVAHRDTG